ncbi:MAG: hypothetical protein H6721_27755 [Sandaracinus sp.]|nr:hypothetical protein [Sandaracinus sp.]MCB9612293.1 hypothetical protein [Sandaracinus sp.]MCB9621020.1 hypothetical protein [Sandaracinus sp.]MCB9635922.1 hypothetical protein [Sandaracinus sp.]
MKFMVMHKHSPDTEAGKPPTPDFVAKMGALIGGAAQRGWLVDGEGLGATRTRSRVTFEGGEARVEHGPYEGRHELPAGFVKVTVTSRDEAIAIARRLGEAIGEDVELEVGKLTETWDLGLSERPADAPERYLVIHKTNPSSEAGQTRPLGDLIALLEKDGIATASGSLAPSYRGKRLLWRGGKRTIQDGPFAESKELIGGYAILEMESMDACVAFTNEYAELLLTQHDSLEIDIRPL